MNMMTDQELKELIASLAVKSDRLDAQLARNQEAWEKRWEKIEESQAKTEAQLARTDKKLDNLGVILGNYGIVQGEMTEEMVYRGSVLGPIGGNIFRGDLENYAKGKGLYVIRQSGDNLELANDANFSPKVFS
jgi:hypothetical protein